MKKLNAQKLIFLILMMMSLNVLLTAHYPVMNKTLALFGIILTVLAFTTHASLIARKKFTNPKRDETNILRARPIEKRKIHKVDVNKKSAIPTRCWDSAFHLA